MKEQVEFLTPLENTENKTFNKLCRLQKLIQKESAMKKLCK